MTILFRWNEYPFAVYVDQAIVFAATESPCMVAAIEATFFSEQVGMWEQKGVSRNNDREFKLQRRLR